MGYPMAEVVHRVTSTQSRGEQHALVAAVFGKLAPPGLVETGAGTNARLLCLHRFLWDSCNFHVHHLPPLQGGKWYMRSTCTTSFTEAPTSQVAVYHVQGAQYAVQRALYACTFKFGLCHHCCVLRLKWQLQAGATPTVLQPTIFATADT
jgi:hypothetical protein